MRMIAATLIKWEYYEVWKKIYKKIYLKEVKE